MFVELCDHGRLREDFVRAGVAHEVHSLLEPVEAAAGEAVDAAWWRGLNHQLAQGLGCALTAEVVTSCWLRCRARSLRKPLMSGDSRVKRSN